MNQKNLVYGIVIVVLLVIATHFAVIGCNQPEKKVGNYEFEVVAIDPGTKHAGISMFDAIITIKNPEQNFFGQYELQYGYRIEGSTLTKYTEPVTLTKLGVVSNNLGNHYGNDIDLPPKDVWFSVVIRGADGKMWHTQKEICLPVDPEWAKTQK